MSTKPVEDSQTFFVCRFCGKVGVGIQPSPVDFGGCVPPNSAHIFQKFDVVVKKKEAPPATKPSGKSA